MKIILSYAFLGLLLCACARHPTKKETFPIAIKDSIINSFPLINDTLPSSFYEDTLTPIYHKILAQNTIDYTYLAAKIIADYQDEKNNLHLTAHLRMRKDSIIWVSVYTFGIIEAFRVQITADSLFLWNKLQGNIERHPLSYIRHLLGMPLDFSTLQSLILGHAYYSSFPQLYTSENGWKINTETLSFQRTDTYDFKDTLLKQSYFSLHTQDSIAVLTTYAQPLAIANGKIYQKRTLSINYPSPISLTLFFESMQIPDLLSFPFKRYKE